MKKLDLSTLNPGIRKTVAQIRLYGLETIDSGDGETHVHECDQERPYVHISVKPEDIMYSAEYLQRILLKYYGIEVQPMNEDNSVPCIEAHYNPADRIATITLWNVKL